MHERKAQPFFVVRFLRGLACAFRALPLVLGSRRMFVLSVVPFLVCLAIYVAFFFGVIALADDVAGLVIEPGTWWRAVIRVALMVSLPLAFLVIAVFTYTLACFAVAGPLYEWLSAAVERKITGGVEEEPFRVRNMLLDVVRGIGFAIGMLLVQLCILLLAFLFVPVTTVLALLGSAVLLALEFLDYPMGRRRMSLRARVRFARRHGWELLGLGLPLLLGLMVPFVGAVFLPVGVVGGTLLFVHLSERDGS